MTSRSISSGGAGYLTDKAAGVNFTSIDKEILCLCPDDWFDESDLHPGVRRSRYRCERLVKAGMLSTRVTGTYPILATQFQRTVRADKWLATDEAKLAAMRLMTTHGWCKDWRSRYNIPKRTN